MVAAEAKGKQMKAITIPRALPLTHAMAGFSQPGLWLVLVNLYQLMTIDSNP